MEDNFKKSAEIALENVRKFLLQLDTLKEFLTDTRNHFKIILGDRNLIVSVYDLEGELVSSEEINIHADKGSPLREGIQKIMVFLDKYHEYDWENYPLTEFESNKWESMKLEDRCRSRKLSLEHLEEALVILKEVVKVKLELAITAATKLKGFSKSLLDSPHILKVEFLKGKISILEETTVFVFPIMGEQSCMKKEVAELFISAHSSEELSYIDLKDPQTWRYGTWRYGTGGNNSHSNASAVSINNFLEVYIKYLEAFIKATKRLYEIKEVNGNKEVNGTLEIIKKLEVGRFTGGLIDKALGKFGIPMVFISLGLQGLLSLHKGKYLKLEYFANALMLHSVVKESDTLVEAVENGLKELDFSKVM